jgi:WD40 repeat protein
MADEITFTCPCGARFEVPKAMRLQRCGLCPACTLKHAFAVLQRAGKAESPPAPAAPPLRPKHYRWHLAALALLCAAGLTWWLWPSAAPPEEPRPAARPSPLDLLSASQIPQALRYAGQPAELVGVLRSRQGPAWAAAAQVAYSADERWRASIDKDVVRLHDAATGAEAAVLDGYKTPQPPADPFLPVALFADRESRTVDRVALSGDGSVLAVLGSHATVKPFHFNSETMSSGPSTEVYHWLQLWDWKKDSLVPRQPLAWQEAPVVKAAALSPDGRLLATGSFAHIDKVQLWKVGEDKPEELLDFTAPGGLEFLLFSPDGRGLVTGRGPSLTLWDITGVLPGGRREGRHALFTRGWITLAAVLGGIALLAGLCKLCWNSGWEKRAWVRRGFGRAAVAASLLLAVCLGLLTWNYCSSRVTKRAAFDMKTGDVAGGAFSADGRLFAAHGGRQATVWDAVTGEVRYCWTMPGPVERLAFTADERHLAAHTADGTACILRLGNLDEAQHLYDCCEAVLKQDPADVDARLGRAQAHLQKGRYDDALADVAEALRRAPQCRDAYFLRGLIRKQTGEGPRAVEDFTEAIRLDGQYAAAFYQRGLLHTGTGAFAQARKDFEEAVRLDPRLARD